MEFSKAEGAVNDGVPDGIREDLSDLETAEQRLNTLLLLNAEFDKLHQDEERANHSQGAAGMYNPVGSRNAFSILGLALGLLPPSGFFLRLVAEKGVDNGEGWVIGLFCLVVLASTLTGFLTGRLVGRIAAEVEEFSWPLMIAVLPFIGITWGILAGGAGGAFLFLIGAIPGAVIGAAVGCVALTAFTVVHRSLARGGEVERSHLIPLAFGVSGAIAAIFMGIPVS